MAERRSYPEHMQSIVRDEKLQLSGMCVTCADSQRSLHAENVTMNGAINQVLRVAFHTSNDLLISYIMKPSAHSPSLNAFARDI